MCWSQTKGEAIALGIAQMSTIELPSYDHGVVVQVKRCIIERDLYLRLGRDMNVNLHAFTVTFRDETNDANHGSLPGSSGSPIHAFAL